jgi:putative sugar ABC transporter, sugar-binding protein
MKVISREDLNMVKRRILSLALSSVMALSLAACGGKSNTDSSSAADGAKSGDGGKITVAIWDNGQKPGLQKIIDDFTASTGYQAELQVITWDQYWTLLEAGASGGDMPDVFWMHSNESQKYMENGILMDLTDKIKSSDKIEMDKFPKDIKSIYEYDKKTYAIPKDVDTIALWYNKKMFDEAGIAYPDDTWTWDDYYNAAVKLTKPDGSQFGTAMNPSNNQDGWYNIVYSMGGKVISDDMKKSGMDDQNTLKAMEYVDKLRKDAMPDATVMSETGTDVLLQSGKIAMLPQGSWMVAPFKENEYIAENCDIAVLPKDATTGKRVSLYNGLGWAANANTKNPEAAWKLIEWFSTKENQEKQAQLGVTMAAYEGVSDIWKNSTDKFNLQAYLTMLNDSELVFRPHSRATVVWENKNTSNLVEAWSNKVSMDDACKKAATDMNELLSQE